MHTRFVLLFHSADRYDSDGGLDGRALALAAKQNAKSLIIICQNLI